jgi:RHS repeat-associated protein
MLMPGRVWPTQTAADLMSDGKKPYRYGFNGKENDYDPKNIQGSQQDYGMRIYDPRLGKFLSVDPLSGEYPWNSTYAFAENSPIAFVDLDGLEKYYAANGQYVGQFGSSTEIRVLNGKALQNSSFTGLQTMLHKANTYIGAAQQFWSNDVLKTNSTVLPANAFNSIRNKDKLLKPFADAVQKSPTFKSLANGLGNIKIASENQGTYTEDKTGNVNIGSKEDYNNKILGLAWEMTNSSNQGRLSSLDNNASNMTEDDYVMGKFKIEAEAFINRGAVAIELGINDPMTEKYLSDINSYKAGTMTKDALISKIAQYGYDNAGAKGPNGEKIKLKDEYSKQYKAIGGTR